MALEKEITSLLQLCHCVASNVEGGDPFSLQNTGVTTPGLLGLILISQERRGHIGESSTNHQKDGEETGASLLQGKDERTGTVQLRKENAQIGLYQGV